MATYSTTTPADGLVNGISGTNYELIPPYTRPNVAKSANYTATGVEGLIEATTGSGGITITLPAASSVTNVELRLVKVDSGAGALSAAPNGTDKINGANSTATVTSTQWAAKTLYSDGTQWLMF